MEIYKHSEDAFKIIFADVNKKSEYMWSLINQNKMKRKVNYIPNHIIQFWSDNDIPEDVKECMDTWNKFSSKGIKYSLFNRVSARDFIKNNYPMYYVKAYDNCSHPALQSDYFRLCYIYLNGGAYIDADDVCLVNDIAQLFRENNLKVQTLCFDMDTNKMVKSSNAYSDKFMKNRIYYVNNNPLIASPKNTVIERALEVATINLSNKVLVGKDFQSIAGPGNLVNSILWNAIVKKEIPVDFCIFWDDIAISKWPLEYRRTNSNWRIWDGKVI